MKQKYDSSVVYLYATGRENLLPRSFRKQIPYTTIATWRRTDYSSYIGHEFRSFFDEAFEAAEVKYQYKQLKSTLLSLARSWLILSSVIQPVFRKTRNNKQLRNNIVYAVNYMQRYLGLEKALKLLGISPAMYREWQLEAKFTCFDSYTSLCVKRHPHQLAAKEIGKIKKCCVILIWTIGPLCPLLPWRFVKKELLPVCTAGINMPGYWA